MECPLVAQVESCAQLLAKSNLAVPGSCAVSARSLTPCLPLNTYLKMAECIGVLSALTFSLVEEFDVQKQQRSMLGRSLHLVIYSELQGLTACLSQLIALVRHWRKAQEILSHLQISPYLLCEIQFTCVLCMNDYTGRVF